MHRSARAIAAALTGVAVLLGCAAAAPPLADHRIVWREVADERVPELVTRDPDGDLRVTKLWLVVVDDQGYVRTGDSRWFRNIERDPDVQLRIGGATHRMRAETIQDPVRRIYVIDAFRRKYGFTDWLVNPVRPESPNILRLRPRP